MTLNNSLAAELCRQLRYRFEVSRIALHGRGRRPVRAILLSDGQCAHNEAQFDPFFRFRRELRTGLDFVFTQRLIAPNELPSALSLRSFDVIGLKFHYKASKEDVLAAAAKIAGAKRRESSLVYFDGNDEANIQWPTLLGACDVYWKKNVLRSREDATRIYHGSTNLTHHVYGRSSADALPAAIDQSWLRRIQCGTSIGLDKKIVALASYFAGDEPRPLHVERSYDAILRAEMPDNWMGKLRMPAVQALKKLNARFKILLPFERVSPEQYVEEMCQSRICVSPFGYGEICYRDFEAAAYGCLLIKPDMGHIESYPDIYQPFETYVPVKWDYSDLEEKISRYLKDESERLRIVRNARRVLRESHSPRWFIAQAERLVAAARGEVGPTGSGDSGKDFTPEAREK